MRNFQRLGVIACIAVLLAGCGPSESDISKAIKSQALEKLKGTRDAASAFAGAMTGGKPPKMIEDMHKSVQAEIEALTITVGKTTEMDDGTYSAVVTIKSPTNGEKTTTVRVADTGKGWRIVE